MCVCAELARLTGASHARAGDWGTLSGELSMTGDISAQQRSRDLYLCCTCKLVCLAFQVLQAL